MSSQNTSNAPMPAAGGGAAETFDSTITPPQGNISSIGLPGPDSTETPIHAGMVNAIDPFFSKQYVATQIFTWNTAQDPGTLLYTVPIHPFHSHQWIKHLAQMYNTYGGGFDFAFKVAGTGFHAGALIFVRLPPNIQPSSIKTMPDLTAFEYFVIDPKTLEVEIKSVMDQRNVMYHWLHDLDLNKPETFGGHIAAYVMMPLNTSSTGATSIQVQVWTKPSPDFMFAQIRPIYGSAPGPSVGEKMLEMALDFTSLGTPRMCNGGSTKKLIVFPGDTTTINYEGMYKANGTSYSHEESGSVVFGPETQIDYNAGSFSNFYLLSLKTYNITATKGTDGYCGLRCQQGVTSRIEFTYADGKTNQQVKRYPIGNGTLVFSFAGDVTITLPVTYSNSGNTVVATVQQRVNDGNMESERFFKASEIPWWKEQASPDLEFFKISKGDIRVSVLNHKTTGSVNCDFAWAPPQKEAIVRPDMSWMGRQFASIQQLFASGVLKNWFLSNEAVFLELIDTRVDLPIGKFKLYYEGFLTTIIPASKVEYDLTSNRYKFKYLHKAPATTPLFSTKKDVKYIRNALMSSLVNN